MIHFLDVDVCRRLPRPQAAIRLGDHDGVIPRHKSSPLPPPPSSGDVARGDAAHGDDASSSPAAPAEPSPRTAARVAEFAAASKASAAARHRFEKLEHASTVIVPLVDVETGLENPATIATIELRLRVVTARDARGERTDAVYEYQRFAPAAIHSAHLAVTRSC